MKDINNKNRFLIAWSSCVLLLLMICYFGFNIRATRAHFNGVTGTLTPWYLVTYSSNWPDTTKANEIRESKEKRDYILLNNMFEVPVGYEFLGWNTKVDGSGDTYLANNSIILTEDLHLYAQWTEIIVDESKVVYGDVNQNDEIDKNDYLLLGDYISGISTLGEQALLNADVNDDGKVDLIDVDIIKQAYLGTDGYTGYLPNKAVLVYELYINNSSDGENAGFDSSEGVGSAEGSSSQGSLSGSGTGGSGGSSGTTGSNNNSGSNNQGIISSNNGVSQESGDALNDTDTSRSTYEFKFMNGELEHDILVCDVSISGSCELPLPLENPLMVGASFWGWSVDKNCATDDIIIAPINVNGSNTYYACFVEIDDNLENSKNTYVWVIVVFLGIISLRLIWYVINRFRKGQ